MKRTQIPYEEADIRVILFEFTDIVTASGGTLSNDQELNYDDGAWT